MELILTIKYYVYHRRTKRVSGETEVGRKGGRQWRDGEGRDWREGKRKRGKGKMER